MATPVSVVSLDPRRRLVVGVADWLLGELREDQGAPSLAHLLVVVPTAESGRRLRLELARRFRSGLVPPEFRLPAALLGEADDLSLASRSDELKAFWEAAGAQADNFDAAAELSDLRRILGANALSFADVAAFFETPAGRDLAPAGEGERWRKLAELERCYVAVLSRRGKRDRIVAAQAAIAAPRVPSGVERLVVAAVLDPLPAFERALANCPVPVVRLEPDFAAGLAVPTRAQIVQSATAADEAERIAAVFATVRPDEMLPALCLADPELFPEVRSALLTQGQEVHNPSLTPLAASSLGQLVRQISALKRTSSYAVFSAFIRNGDVCRWLKGEIAFRKDADRAAVWAQAMADLDNLQAKLLPEKIEDIAPHAQHTLRAIFDLVTNSLRKLDLPGMLRVIFRDRQLDEHNPDAREFAAAAAAVMALVDEDVPADLPPRMGEELFARRLDETSYSLEADEGVAVVTDGWLELPYLDADEVIISGFNEGIVPESVFGHPYLPDRLRKELGLPDNQQRMMRDARILSLTLSCRPENAVRIFFHALNAAGDQLKPSRLLFEGLDDAELACRVRLYYAASVGTSEGLPADLPEAWRLQLPKPPAREVLLRSSASAIDAYLRCPFTYFLKQQFGESDDDRAEELDPAEFGNLAHDALERWGRGENRHAVDAGLIAAELAGHVDAILAERFGTSVPAIVSLQGESLKSRLANFADIQAARRREGWEIVATERRMDVTYGKTRFVGRIDRVDYRPSTGEWCVIDYKTYEEASRAVAYDARKNVWKSLQLPLYVAMLDADRGDFAAADRAHTLSVYCVIGKSRSEVVFSEPMRGELVSEAERVLRRQVDRIERGIFWPPSSENAWKNDFGSWILGTPRDSVSAAWIDDQERRLKEVDDG